jgi:thiol-disulfide isomerase/thioredoxin
MDKEYFIKGKTFSEYACESPSFRNLYRRITISPENERFFSLKRVCVLIISEPWCGDCKREIPLLARIADMAGWQLRIFGRDTNPDLMDRYTTEGKRKIPVIVFFDEGFRELGRFVESAPDGKTTIDVLKEILKS